ncbi:MAG: iron transporter [Spirochaetota bacterium]
MRTQRTYKALLLGLFLSLGTGVWAKGESPASPAAQTRSSGGTSAVGIGGVPELVIGEERIEPGIIFIFEGAIKDTVYPLMDHLKEDSTNIHIEARANWAEENIPEGTPPGGFVAYLAMTAEITNQATGYKTFIDLLPHINLIDNLHYARNVTLPGKASDLYTVAFTVTAPTGKAYVSIHKDWSEQYGDALMKDTKLIYKDVDFEQIAKATRN